jgi:uncharacterized protein
VEEAVAEVVAVAVVAVSAEEISTEIINRLEIKNTNATPARGIFYLQVFKLQHSRMNTSAKANRLLTATSPYLLQHAHNPVDWYEWGEAALQRSKKEDKPILLSIGYSSCHWCHVMAHESFENNDIAQLMNEHFICIKLDREERPDIDQIYMEALQAMGQNGGWPLNIFLTPEQKPFFGGTYFPPKNWAQLLLQLNIAFKSKRKEIEDSATDLCNHLSVSDLQRFKNVPTENGITTTTLDAMFHLLESRFDFVNGGIDKAPKFIMPSVWLFLARYYHISKKEKALEMLNLTLKKIAAGGIYDQLGGGFARYSVDGEWFAPHFEKMLYDNAQLISLYSEAYSLTKEETYKRVVYETINWLEQEMTSRQGGFFSALDADSEGEEGKFYTWTKSDLDNLDARERGLLLTYYGVTNSGNWEHGKNILKRDSEVELPVEIKKLSEKMLDLRAKRTRPSLDDKILVCWNCMAIQGLVDAYRAFGDGHFLNLAENAIQFIEANLISGNSIYRSYKEKRSAITGFIDDYAFLIQAYTSLYQTTFNEKYAEKAKQWCQITIDNFFDPADGLFYFNSNQAEALIARKKEIFDNVIPSSNAVMARNLHYLGTLWDNHSWIAMGTNMIKRLSNLIASEPVYMSQWAIFATDLTVGLSEVVIAGSQREYLRKEMSMNYLPFTILMGADAETRLPLTLGKNTGHESKLFVCYDKTCKLPVNLVSDALLQIPTSNS